MRRGFTIWFFKLNSHTVINTARFIETHVRITDIELTGLVVTRQSVKTMSVQEQKRRCAM